MKYRMFFVLLVLFCAVVGFLNWLLNPAPPLYPSIGGGGYDLSKPVYTLLLLIFTSLWTVIMLVTGWMSRKPMTSRQSFILAGIGALTVLASFAAYHDNLN